MEWHARRFRLAWPARFSDDDFLAVSAATIVVHLLHVVPADAQRTTLPEGMRSYQESGRRPSVFGRCGFRNTRPLYPTPDTGICFFTS